MRNIILFLTIFSAACGTSSMTPPGPDGGMNNGDAHTYVVSAMHVPVNMADGQKYGLDVGQAASSLPDGTVDNKLGTALGQLKQLVPDATGTAIAQGNILLLLDVQAADLASGDAGFTTRVGTNPSPAPCNDVNDMTCGHHLDGTGTFDVAASDPRNTPLPGMITNGVFDGGPGDLIVQFTVGSSTVATVDLANARVHATGISADGVTNAILAGAVTSSDMTNEVLPAIRDGLLVTIARDCGTDCNCTSASMGATVKSLFGTCAITVDTIKAQAQMASLLAPDVCVEASCSQPDGVSLGLGVTAVDGAFTP